MVLVDLDVGWAVHWPQFQHFAFTHVHWREHVFPVVSPVAGSLVGVQVHQNWRINVLVAGCDFLVHDVAFNDPADSGTLWHPVWQTCPSLRVNEEEIQVPADSPVISFLDFCPPLKVSFQVSFLEEGSPEDSLQHWV